MIHAKYSPSMIGRVLHCPGSVRLCDTLPPSLESVYSKEGVLLHDYAKVAVDTFFHEHTGSIGGTSWNGYRYAKNMTKEHEELILGVVDQLQQRIIPADGGFCEVIQDIRVHTTDEVNGTLDLAVVTDDAVHIVDFKFGAGVPVEAEGNEQLLCYLEGFLNGTYSSLPKMNLYAKDWYIWIFQPRLERYLCAHVDVREMDQFIKRMNRAIRLSKVPNPPFNAGEHCRTKFCPAGGCCKARLQYANEEAAAVFGLGDDKDGRPNWTMTNAELAEFYKQEKEVVSAFAAIKEYLFNELYAGRKVQGYKLVAGRGRREWASGLDADKLEDAFPELDTEEIFDIKLRSPAQMEKLLPKEQRKDLEQFIVNIEGAPAIAPDTSSKVEIETASSVFKGCM